MALETVTGSLLAYKELEPGTFQHVDQITTERRDNRGLRDRWFYTADGELYTVQKRKHLWVITREPQNLVLRNIDEAYRQLTSQGNYFPDAEAAKTSLEHEDSVVIDLKGLRLARDNDQYGHFAVNPRAVKKLNPEQRRAAQRIYGPDEKKFGLNMEMFAEARKTLYVFVLTPDYVQGALRNNDQKFLGRASWLNYFNNDFYVDVRYVDSRYALRGVRRVIAEALPLQSHERSDLSDAPKNEVLQAPPEAQEKQVVTLERMLELSRSHVADSSWPVWEQTLRKEYKQ